MTRLQTNVFDSTQGATRTRAEWHEFMDRVVAEYGAELPKRRAVYQEAGSLTYRDASGQARSNPWLNCAGWAVKDIGGGIQYLTSMKPYYTSFMQSLIDDKIRWLDTVNREIWILWLPGNLVMQSGRPPEEHPLFEDLTAEWKLAAQICWEEGANSYNGCAAHSYAEQSAIERVSVFGLAGPHYFGPHTHDPLGWVHQKLGAIRTLAWHAPLQLPGFALSRRPEQPRDWRRLRDRIEYVVGSCCTACSNNMIREGSDGVCCDKQPRNWDGIIDRSFAAMLGEPVAGRNKLYAVHPRLEEYVAALRNGKPERRGESPLIARFIRDLPMFVPGLSSEELRRIEKESRRPLPKAVGLSAAIQFGKDWMPDGLWYRIAKKAMG